MALLVKHSNLELDELEFDPISDLCDPAVLPVLPVRHTHRPAASACLLLVKLEGDSCCPAHCNGLFICQEDQS